MAPAAQYREKEPLPFKSTDSYRSTSTFKWPSATPDLHAIRRFPIPQIQGIIPGVRNSHPVDAASPSLPPSLSSSHDVASTTPIILGTPTPPSPRQSKYPRISPPGFLYPEEIVPHTAMSARNSNPLHYPDSVPQNKSPYHSSVMGRVDYELSYLPVGYKILLVGTLAVMVLGVAWTLMVWAVNARMEMRSAMNEGKGTRKRRVRSRSMGKERRPIDKVSKYAHRHGGRSEIRAEAATDMDMDNDSAITSAAQIPFSYLGNNGHVGENIEMKCRPRHKILQPNRPRSRQIHTETRDSTHTSHGRISSSPSPSSLFNHPSTPTIRAPHSPTPSVAPSPENPFLDPPPNGLLQPGTSSELVKRTSLEWKAGRAAFFAPETASMTPTTGSRSVSPAPSSTNDHGSEAFELDVSDIEALEAGTAPLTGRKHVQSESSPSSTGSGLIEKSKSWIDEGVELVDGAVSAVAAQIGRWTDDDGGDESSLLPYASRGRGRGVSVA